MKLARIFAVAGALSWVVVATTPAAAQAVPPPPPEAPSSPAPITGEGRAAALKEQGDAAMDTLHYDEALKLYAESYAASPNPAILYNQARVYQARGEYPDALAALQRFDAEAPPELKARVPGYQGLLTELRGHVATLEVRCEVAGARVTLGDRFLGTTPIAKPFTLNAGTATLFVTREGYAPYSRLVDLRGGGTTLLEVPLVLLARAGILLVKVTGPAAEVSVDGQPKGMTPLELPLDPGPHPVRVHRDGSLDFDTSTIIVAGQRKELSLELNARRPITQTWWFWTTVGVVVAGGVAITYAALKERSPSSGDQFSPGVASVALTRW